MNGVNHDAEEREPSESPEEDEEEEAFETLDFRNAKSAREATSAKSIVASPVRSKSSNYEYENGLGNPESNVTLYSCNSINPVRFIFEFSCIYVYTCLLKNKRS